MKKGYIVFSSRVKVSLKIILLFLMPMTAFSQIATVKDSVEIVPKALAVSAITDYSENTRELIVKTRTLFENTNELIEIQQGLISYDSLIQNQLVQLKNTLVNFNLNQLDKVKNKINIYNEKIKPWVDKVEEWTLLSEEKRNQIDITYQTWNLTIDSLKTERKNLTNNEISKVMLFNRAIDRIALNVKTLDELKVEFNAWHEELLNTENTLAILTGEVNESFEIIAAKRGKFVYSIWNPERQPIWEILGDTPVVSSDGSYKTQLQDVKEVILSYHENNEKIYFSLLFNFIIILCIVLYIRNKAKQLFRERPDVIEENNFILKYPVISSFIILNFIVFIFYNIPSQLEYVVLLIAILPFSLLLWEHSSNYKPQRILLFVMSCLIFTSFDVLANHMTVLRISLLIINAVVIYLLLKVQRNKDLIVQEQRYWLGALSFLVTVFVFLSIIAIIANIIGSVQLSAVLTRSTIGTFLAFAIIKESVGLFQSFIFLLLLGPLYKYSNILKDNGKQVLESLGKYLRVLGFGIWAYIILDFLQIRDLLFEGFMNFINTPLEIGELSISFGNIITFYIILQISIWISKFIRYFLEKEVYPRTNLDQGDSSTISLMIRYTLSFIGLLFALTGADVELSKVIVGVGALGIGIGFGLQNIVNNFVSGIILALERPIKIGDIVKVDEIEGEVIDIGIRASQIKNWAGADVLVPNGYLISGKLTNYTFDENIRRLDLEVHLPLDADITRASEIILETTASVKDVMKNPKPNFNFEGVKNGAFVIKVYAWISDFGAGFRVGTAFRIAVYKALKKEGFEISKPILDVQLSENELKKTRTNELDIGTALSYEEEKFTAC